MNSSSSTACCRHQRVRASAWNSTATPSSTSPKRPKLSVEHAHDTSNAYFFSSSEIFWCGLNMSLKGCSH